MKYRAGIDYKPITNQQIKDIAGSHDGVDSDALRSALDEVAEQFIHNHCDQQKFPHADLETTFNNIVSTATRLLVLLKSGNRTKRHFNHIINSAKRLHVMLTFNTSASFELESILNVGHTGEKEKAQRESFGGNLVSLIVGVKLLKDANSWDAKIPDISSQLDLLRRVAFHAAVTQRSQKEKTKIRHKEDQAFSELLAGIRQSYMAHFGIWPKMSRKSGEPDGEFIAFVFSVLKTIKENLSSVVRDGDQKISSTLTKTAEAIYAKIKEFNNEQNKF